MPAGSDLTPVPLADVPAALLALDLLVAGDMSPVGLTGHLVVGVRDGEVDAYWSADFTRNRFGFFRREPPFCDALLVVSAAGARTLLGGRAPNAHDILSASGDAALVDRFVGRYGQKRSALDLRSGEGP